jgi:hypothetical protein
MRRRLFESMVNPTQFKDRDVVARAFADLYRSQHQEFPPECRDAEVKYRAHRPLKHMLADQFAHVERDGTVVFDGALALRSSVACRDGAPRYSLASDQPLPGRLRHVLIPSSKCLDIFPH